MGAAYDVQGAFHSLSSGMIRDVPEVRVRRQHRQVMAYTQTDKQRRIVSNGTPTKADREVDRDSAPSLRGSRDRPDL